MNLRSQARLLRTEGNSFRNIAKKLNIPVSTAHLWAREIKLSKAYRELLKQKSLQALQRSRKIAQRRKKRKYDEGVNKNLSLGKKIIGKKITQRELLLIGASLYWAEGFKRDSRLGFANSDPAMIRVFLYWLTEVFKVDREKIRLRVGANISFKHKIKEIENYWSNETGIQRKQFNKAFFQKTILKRNYSNREEYHGVLRIRAIGQNEIFRQILGMIEGLRQII